MVCTSPRGKPPPWRASRNLRTVYGRSASGKLSLRALQCGPAGLRDRCPAIGSSQLPHDVGGLHCCHPSGHEVLASPPAATDRASETAIKEADRLTGRRMVCAASAASLAKAGVVPTVATTDALTVKDRVRTIK